MTSGERGRMRGTKRKRQGTPLRRRQGKPLRRREKNESWGDLNKSRSEETLGDPHNPRELIFAVIIVFKITVLYISAGSLVSICQTLDTFGRTSLRKNYCNAKNNVDMKRISLHYIRQNFSLHLPNYDPKIRQNLQSYRH